MFSTEVVTDLMVACDQLCQHTGADLRNSDRNISFRGSCTSLPRDRNRQHTLSAAPVDDLLFVRASDSCALAAADCVM